MFPNFEKYKNLSKKELKEELKEKEKILTTTLSYWMKVFVESDIKELKKLINEKK